MNWINVSSFLDKFRYLSPPHFFLLDLVVKNIQETTGLILKREEVELRNNFIYIKNLNILKKNVIFLNKDKILRKLLEKLGEKAPKEIRF